MEDLPGGARAHRPERIVLGVEGEVLERLVADHREWKADDRREAVRRHPRVRDARYRQGLPEDVLVAGEDQREKPRIALALRDAEQAHEPEIHLVHTVEGLVAGGADRPGPAAPSRGS